MSLEVKGTLSGLAAALGLLGIAVGLSPLRNAREVADRRGAQPPGAATVSARAMGVAQVKRGFGLFDHNCASCHGDDGRGGEGPSLRNLALSDTRIAKRIREGIKGEMPRFGSKFDDADIAALIAWLRTLKD